MMFESQVNQASNQDPMEKASRALEAMMIKQLLKSSGVFKGGDAAGSSVRADMFAEVLAESVANAGGMGISEFSTPAAPIVPSLGGAPVRATHRQDSAIDAQSIVPGGRVTSDFGERIDPINHLHSQHAGVDIAAAEGTAILAAADGTVRRAGVRGGYGNSVELDHGAASTLYGHASEILVSEGENVVKGQIIGRVGRTGRATGSHLHFEVRVGEHPVNPSKALNAYATCADEKVGR